MPFSHNWYEKRLHLCVLAALSITIMLFTVVHFRHFLPHASRHLGPTQHALGLGVDCNHLFYASDAVECAEWMQDVEAIEAQIRAEDEQAGAKDWL